MVGSPRAARPGRRDLAGEQPGRARLYVGGAVVYATSMMA